MKIIFYTVYGTRRSYHLELTYSVLSAARFLKEEPDDLRLVLITDSDNQRPDLPVEHMIISLEDQRKWQLDGTYNHAIQVYALHHALRHFDAPTVLMDTDTIFKAHPKLLFDRIRPGIALTNAKEGRLCDSPEWPEWRDLIEQSAGQLAGWPVTPESVMHNGGILGLHPRDAHLLDEVKLVMGEIRDHSSVFTAVQLAASIVLGSKLELSTCEDLVEHYWDGPRAYYHYQINRMFPEVLKGQSIQALKSQLLPLERSLPGSLTARVAARLKRVQRKAGAEYGYAYMAYLSALSSRQKDPELANVWAGTALDMLVWGSRERFPQTPADFAFFAPDRLEAQTWMQSGLRKRWQDYWAAENNSSKTNSL